jgi:hypothetical protein
MKLSDIVPFIVIPSLAFYGVVYGVDWAITAIEYYCYIMLALCVFVVYCVAFTDFGDEYLNKAKLRATNHSPLKRKFGYVLMLATSAFLINNDYIMISIMIFITLIVNQYLAYRIINENK